MSFSRSAAEQRSKEAKTLKFILAYSLIGSLALHVAVLLATGIGNFLPKVSSSKEEPIEISIIDAPKPPLEKKQQTKQEVALRTQPKANVSPFVNSSRVMTQKEHDATATTLLHKFSDNLNTPSVHHRSSQTPEKTKNPQLTRQLRPVAIESPVQKEGTLVKLAHSSRTKPTLESNLGANSSQSEPVGGEHENSSLKSGNPIGAIVHPDVASKPQPQSASFQGSGKLTQTLRGVRDFRANEESTGNHTSSSNLGSTVSHSTVAANSGTGNGTGSNLGTRVGTSSLIGTRVSTGNGTSSGTSKGSGSGIGNGETVATGSSPARIGTSSDFGNGRGNSSGAGNGRAACSECATKYPEQARRRGIEGRVEVAVDTDEKGHVTNVRLTHSSGHPELDEDTLKQARNWRLKPATGGRQGVAVAADYALEGSRRHRERSERKKQKQAEQTNQNTTPDNSSSRESNLLRKRRLTTGTIVDVPTEPITERRQESTSSYSRPATIRAQAALSRRLRRESGASNQPQESSSTEASHQQRLRESQHKSPHQSVSSDSPSSKEASTTRRQPTDATASSESRLSSSQRHRGSQDSTFSSQQRLLNSLRRSRATNQSPNTSDSPP